MDKYLSNVITETDLQHIIPGQFNVLRAPCGSGKTTFIFDERFLQLAREKKHILYLIHNQTTRDYIATRHSDVARVWGDNGWLDKRKKNCGMWSTEEDSDYVQVMCYQTFAALLRTEGTSWLDDIDLIVWDEFDDFRPYYEREVAMIKKILPDFSREKLIALLQEGRPKSVVNFIWKIRSVILEPARIRMVAVSATPELAAAYFNEYVNYIFTGKLECLNDAKETLFIKNVIDSIENGTFTPQEGRRYWCYTKYIYEALAIEATARAYGFDTIALWSESNAAHRAQYTEEKAKVTKIIKEMHEVPRPYNFIVTTGVLGRGVDIFDDSIQDWICNSTDYEEIVQSNRARFSPARRYLLASTCGLVEFIQNGFAAEYYQWHSLPELRELLETHPIFSGGPAPKKLPTFNAARKEYPELFESRKYGKSKITQYRIKPPA